MAAENDAAAMGVDMVIVGDGGGDGDGHAAAVHVEDGAGRGEQRFARTTATASAARTASATRQRAPGGRSGGRVVSGVIGVLERAGVGGGGTVLARFGSGGVRGGAGAAPTGVAAVSARGGCGAGALGERAATRRGHIGRWHGVLAVADGRSAHFATAHRVHVAGGGVFQRSTRGTVGGVPRVGDARIRSGSVSGCGGGDGGGGAAMDQRLVVGLSTTPQRVRFEDRCGTAKQFPGGVGAGRGCYRGARPQRAVRVGTRSGCPGVRQLGAVPGERLPSGAVGAVYELPIELLLPIHVRRQGFVSVGGSGVGRAHRDDADHARLGGRRAGQRLSGSRHGAVLAGGSADYRIGDRGRATGASVCASQPAQVAGGVAAGYVDVSVAAGVAGVAEEDVTQEKVEKALGYNLDADCMELLQKTGGALLQRTNL
eukprot:ctg_196.g63